MHRGSAGEALAAAVMAVFAAGCGARPSKLLDDSAVKGALADLAARGEAAGDCAVFAEAFDTPSFGAWMDDYGRDDPPPLEGAWDYSDCQQTGADTFPAQTVCGGSVVWTLEHDGRISQDDTDGVSVGEGDEAYIVAARGGAYIVQETHATARGCEQDFVNIFAVGPESARFRPFTGISVVRSSSCAAPKWTCSEARLSSAAQGNDALP